MYFIFKFQDYIVQFNHQSKCSSLLPDWLTKAYRNNLWKLIVDFLENDESTFSILIKIFVLMFLRKKLSSGFISQYMINLLLDCIVTSTLICGRKVPKKHQYICHSWLISNHSNQWNNLILFIFKRFTNFNF